MYKNRIALLLLMALSGLSLQRFASGEVPADLAGSWQAEEYVLKDGSRHQVKGPIFFTEEEWSITFFVLDDKGVIVRGASEGGTYTLEGQSLTFRHLYNLSSGEDVSNLTDGSLRMKWNEAADAPIEKCRVEVRGDRLSVHFPSGNRMLFKKSQ